MGMDQVRGCLLTDFCWGFLHDIVHIAQQWSGIDVMKNVYSPTIWETVAQGCKLFILGMDTLIEKSVLY